MTDESTRTPRKPAAKRAPAKSAPAAKAPRKTAKAEEERVTPAKAGTRSGGRPEAIGLRLRYRDDVVPALVREFGYANPMEVPRVEKVVVNIGLGEAIQNAKAIDAAVGDLAIITGQKPIVTRATRSRKSYIR